MKKLTETWLEPAANLATIEIWSNMELDEIFVSVQTDPTDPSSWIEVGSQRIGRDADDETACLFARNMVNEADWVVGAINMVVIREDGFGIRILYEGP